jgi:hypothetical protein
MLQDYRSGHVSISLISTSEIDVGPGGVMLSNAGGSVRLMVANAALTAVSSTMIDTGTISASSTYYLYAYASSTTATTFSVIFSASSSAPTGITYYTRLGSFTTDSSKNFHSVLNDVNAQVGLGSWSSISANTIYSASTDLFVTAYGAGNSGVAYIQILTDSNSTPTTLRAYNGANTGGWLSYNLNCMVKKGDYYEVVTSNISSFIGYSISIGT